MPIDYTRYPPNWKTEIVPRILERENHQCKFCELQNGQLVYSAALQMKQGERYKTRRIWITTETDRVRLEVVAQPNSMKQVKVVLTIAHLDHDEENHNVTDDRLAALCQYCHLNYDADEKWRRAITKADQEALPLEPRG